METEVEALAVLCRNKNEDNFYLMRFLQMIMIIFWQKFLVKVAMSENEFSDKNVATNNPNSLTCVITGEIHTDNEADDFWHA